MRIVIAEDSVLLREGITRLLAEYDHEVVDALGDSDRVARVGHPAPARPGDRRRADAAHAHRRRATRHGRAAPRPAGHAGAGAVAVRRGARYASDLLAGGTVGVGYLLKERVADVRDFVDAAQRVAGGGTALDPEVVAQLLVRSRRREPLDALTPHEREVLSHMAQGRSNTAIARSLVVSEGAVEKHISSIFAKLDLAPSEHEHRRVLAVLAFLQSD